LRSREKNEVAISDFLVSEVATAFSAILIGLVATILGAVATGRLVAKARSNEAEDLKEIRKERQDIREKIVRDDGRTFEAAELNLTELKEYYTINKSQARNSFWISVVAFLAGLSTIIAAIVISVSQPSLGSTAGIAVGLAGALVEIVSGGYILVYRKSLTQADYFFSELIKAQDTMLAVRLADQTDDSAKRALLKERVIEALLERHTKNGTPNKPANAPDSG
jgi:hypothetical protein